MPHPASLILALLAPQIVGEPPPSGWTGGTFLPDLALALTCLILAGGLATGRRSISRAVAERLRALAESSPVRQSRVEALLERIDRVAIGVGLLELCSEVGFALFLARFLAAGAALSLAQGLGTLLIGAPLLWFATDALAQAVALRQGDRLLVEASTRLHFLLAPLVGLGWIFDHLQRGLMRLLRIKDNAQETREIVADLRSVLADSEVSGKLQDSERAIIGNVMDFRSEDVAALMTPRTSIQAADVEDGVLEAARVLASSGHSIIPIYEGTLDTIIGTISTRDLVRLTAANRLEKANLQQIVHPAYFVPETKRVAELLDELRSEKIKMAIVLDEYGGTAGLITVGDILAELVGNIPDEYDEDEPSPLRHLAGGAVEIDAGLHVSEVNEALELDLPEEADYETLGGFVLAELGHFPSSGESFLRGPHRFEVVEANDRRVLKVRIRRNAVVGAS